MRVNRDSRARQGALRRRAMVGPLAVGLALGGTASAPAFADHKEAAATAAAPQCSAAYQIEQKLSTGTTWRMCWRFESRSGVILDDISYQPPGESQPIKVLNSAKLAQIDVPYDDGSVEYN